MPVKPMGGLSIIASLFVLGVEGINKKVKKPKKGRPKKEKNKNVLIFSILILMIVSSYLIYAITKNPIIEESDLVLGKLDKCEIEYNKIGTKNVILRIDDIGQGGFEEAQERIIQDVNKRNMTVVLGVIPNNLMEDRTIIKILLKNRCSMEIALHGYEHNGAEFENLTYKEADKKIKKGLKILHKLDTQIVTFIPPENIYSSDSEKAILNNGIDIISPSDNWMNDEEIISTYDWEKEYLRNVNVVIDDCKRKFNKYENCVIMIHPQDYLSNKKIDQYKYQQFLKLLQWIETENISTVNYRDLNKLKEVKND